MGSDDQAGRLPGMALWCPNLGLLRVMPRALLSDFASCFCQGLTGLLGVPVRGMRSQADFADLSWLTKGIRRGRPLTPCIVQGLGWDHLHIPTVDFLYAPPVPDLHRGVDFISGILWRTPCRVVSLAHTFFGRQRRVVSMAHTLSGRIFGTALPTVSSAF